jgi:type I restriction enzyme S subunit
MSSPRYPKYKASGLEWLGDVPEGWAVKRLRFVVNLNPSKSEVAVLDRGTAVSFLPMEAVGDDGTLTLDKEKSIAELETGYTYFRDGDVTIAKITPCYENGKGAIMRDLTNGIGFGTTELIVARPMASQITDTYLHYIFISPDFRGIGESHMYGAGGQKRVPDVFVRNFAMGIPPLIEQTAIVEFLNWETVKIDGLVAVQRRLMELLKEKRQAVISHAVTKGLNPHAPMKPSGIEWLGDVPEHWGVWKLTHAFEKIGSGTTPKTGNREYYDDGNHLWVITGDLNDSDLTDCEKKITSRALRDHSTLKVYPAGSVVIAMYGATIGKLAILQFRASVNQACCVFSGKLKIEYKFLFYFLLAFRQQIISLASGGGQPNVNQDILRGLRVACPDLSEQAAIIKFLESETAKLDALTAKTQRVIDLLQERRAALISAAVTGQIDVRH